MEKEKDVVFDLTAEESQLYREVLSRSPILSCANNLADGDESAVERFYAEIEEAVSRSKYDFDSFLMRWQDNYVAQVGVDVADEGDIAKQMKSIRLKLEFATSPEAEDMRLFMETVINADRVFGFLPLYDPELDDSEWRVNHLMLIVKMGAEIGEVNPEATNLFAYQVYRWGVKTGLLMDQQTDEDEAWAIRAVWGVLTMAAKRRSSGADRVEV
jgi:hypothetical protein